MSKRSLFTHITPLPPNVSREAAVEWLHNHKEMIELNPLVLRHRRCDPHDNAPLDEHGCHWYEMTDQINYLPGGLMKGEVTYKAAFHDLPHGLQTHVYAPAGLDLREKWTVCGNLPGEPRLPIEIGNAAIPRDGLYIREDVDMRCNIFLSGFVKKNLSKSHKVVVNKVVQKAAAAAASSSASALQAKQTEDQRLQQQTRPVDIPELQGSAPIKGELPACQCAGEHEPTCSMYVDPTIGRFADFHVDEQKASTLPAIEPVPYEPFQFVKVTPTDTSNHPELFSGNFHPLSHYHLLLGNNKTGDDEAPYVQTANVSVVTAELPASPV